MGLIDSASTPAAPNAAPAMPADLSPDAIMAKMHIPPKMQQPFQAVIVAGMKMMFSPQSHQLMMQHLSGPQPMPQKLGEGIAGLMALLFQQAQRSIPPQMLIPAGMVLMAHAADFLNKSGQPVTAQDFGAAVQIMVETILKAFKVDPAKVLAQTGGNTAQATAKGAP